MRYDLAFGHDEDVAKWAFDKLGMKLSRPYRAIGILRISDDGEGRIVGAWVMNGYNGANVDLTLVLEPGTPLQRSHLRKVADYIFHGLKCTRMTARTRRDNHAMLALLPRLGFTPEGKQPRYYGSTKEHDALVWGVIRKNCPWLPLADGGYNRRARSPRSRQNGSGTSPV